MVVMVVVVQGRRCCDDGMWEWYGWSEKSMVEWGAFVLKVTAGYFEVLGYVA